MKRSPLKRKTGMRAVNSKRSRAKHETNYGAEAVVVRSLWCLCNAGLCAELRDIGDGDTEEIEARWCSGAIVAAHVVSRGAGGGRFDIVPLCTKHHDEQHATGIETFAAAFGLDLRALADAQALAHEPPLGVRGLAARWAFWHELSDADLDKVDDPPLSPVGYDQAALFGWVLRRMAADTTLDHAIHQDRDGLADIIADDLGIADAWALCELAGWPS